MNEPADGAPAGAAWLCWGWQASVSSGGRNVSDAHDAHCQKLGFSDPG